MRIQFALLMLACLLVRTACAQLPDSQQQAFVKLLRMSPRVASTARDVREGKISRDKTARIVLILGNTCEVEIHRMRGATGNQVFVHKNGHQEAVYGPDGQLVNDGINDASYNYFPRDKAPLRHFTFDMFPWLLLGSSAADPTTRKERLHAYALDVFEGARHARELKAAIRDLKSVQLQQLGCAEAVAVFLVAIDSGDAEKMLALVDSDQQISDKERIAIIGAFEKGLTTLFDGEETPKAWHTH